MNNARTSIRIVYILWGNIQMSMSEKAIITALCMIYKDDKILLQNKVSGWVDLTFPGGHIEKDESFVLVVLLFKTNEFSGDLISSEEGEMVWVSRSELDKYNVAKGFFDTLKIFDDDTITEMIYERNEKDDGLEWILKYY